MIKALVPVSGGKDSQACLALAVAEFGREYVGGLFCDTQFEHPKTYAHIEKMRQLYGVEIIKITAGSVPEKVRRYGRFPSFAARHCTDELKITPTKYFCKALAIKQGGFQVWYGMRTGESDRRAKRYAGKVDTELYAPNEVMRKYPKYLSKMGVSFRLPILDWSGLDVLNFLAGNENPLYNEGFDRVGCFPCLAAGDQWKEKAFAHDDFGREQKKIALQLEKDTGKSVWTSKGGAFRNESGQGCLICQI